MKSWYLIQTKPRQEKKAKEQLERQGYETYLPLAPVRRRRRAKIVRAIDALFPRYLFIHLSDQIDDWRPIRSTIGVSSLVKFGDTPAKVPNQLIESLHKREDAEGLHMLSNPDFHEGDTVRVAEGPMLGYEGIYQCKTGNERVILLLQIAERQARVQLEAGQIEPL